jgi:hypothetical protein
MKMVKYLIEARAQSTPLLRGSSCAALMPRPVRQEEGADVDVMDRYENTPLVDAVRHQQDKVAAFIRGAAHAPRKHNAAAVP